MNAYAKYNAAVAKSGGPGGDAEDVPVVLGLFEGFGPVSKERARRFAKEGVKILVLGINHEDDDRKGVEWEDLKDDFKIFHGRDKMLESIDNLEEVGILVILMGWLRANKRWVNSTLSVCRDLIEHDNVIGWLSDGERFLHSHKVREPGYDHRRAAKEIVGPFWDALRLEFGRLVGLTDYASLPAATRFYVRRLVPGDFMVPQVLARASWYRKNTVYHPRKIIPLGARSWRAEAAPGVRLVLETALYDQRGWVSTRDYGSVRAVVEDSIRLCLEQNPWGIFPWSDRAADKLVWNLYQREYERLGLCG